jgi:hypothetical protein
MTMIKLPYEEQVAALLAGPRPNCTASRCGRKADQIVDINGSAVAYCDDHAWAWAREINARRELNEFFREHQHDPIRLNERTE